MQWTQRTVWKMLWNNPFESFTLVHLPEGEWRERLLFRRHALRYSEPDLW
jgi:hypothetical protein